MHSVMDLFKQMEIHDKRNKFCKSSNAPITKKSLKAKTPESLRLNMTFAGDEMEDVEVNLRQVLDRKLAMYKILYPFLPVDQIQNKVIESLGLQGKKGFFGAKGSVKNSMTISTVKVHPVMMSDFHTYYTSCLASMDQSGHNLKTHLSFTNSCDVSPAAKVSKSLLPASQTGPETAVTAKPNPVFKKPPTPMPSKTAKKVESETSSVSAESACLLFADVKSVPDTPRPKPKTDLSPVKISKKSLRVAGSISDASNGGTRENTPISPVKKSKKKKNGKVYHSSPMKPCENIPSGFPCQSESSISIEEDTARFQKALSARKRHATPIPARSPIKLRRTSTPLVERNVFQQNRTRPPTPLKKVEQSLASEETYQDSIIANRKQLYQHPLKEVEQSLASEETYQDSIIANRKQLYQNPQKEVERSSASDKTYQDSIIAKRKQVNQHPLKEFEQSLASEETYQDSIIANRKQLHQHPHMEVEQSLASEKTYQDSIIAKKKQLHQHPLIASTPSATKTGKVLEKRGGNETTPKSGMPKSGDTPFTAAESSEEEQYEEEIEEDEEDQLGLPVASYIAKVSSFLEKIEPEKYPLEMDVADLYNNSYAP